MERMKQNIKYVSIGMYKQLEEENKKLKMSLEEKDENCYSLAKENEQLNKELEQAIYWKVDYEKSYKQADAKKDELLEENKKLNIKVVSLEGEIKGLNYTIDKLHKELEEQEAEGGGLFDEIDYRKREAKRLGWKPNK